MSISIIIVEIAVLLLGFTVLVFGLLLISPLTFISDYPPEIQAEYYRSQHKEATKEKLTKLMFAKKLLAVVVFLFVFAWMLHLAGAKTFWQGVGLSWVYLLCVFAWDTFFLDWVLFANIKRVRLPGTEHMEAEYHQKWFHVKVCLPVVPFAVLASLLSSGLMLWLWQGGSRMKYIGMPFAVWQFFFASFEKNLPAVFGITKADAKSTMARAKEQYKEIIGNLPEFEKGDRFQMNIVGCAMLAAVVLYMPERPDVEKLTVYYRSSMMTAPMKCFCRMSGKRKFTPKDIAALRKTAAFRAADRNPYSWNMDFLPYADHSGYEARFTRCGICTLMQELGLFDLVPAMCALDYAMSEAGGASQFVRECTLADGDGYCDCGYKKRTEKKQ